ncbi:PemK-like protein [Bacillus cereus]|nr:PemK-like protein [Bacillus cereus]
MALKIFKRGQVFKGYIPEFKDDPRAPKPGFILYGEHRFIVLHDDDEAHISKNIVLVVPITTATAEVTKAFKEKRNILESYVLLQKSHYHFLDHDSYASTAQTFPASRKWIEETAIGQIDEKKLREIDFQMIRTYGLMNAVKSIAEQYAAEQMALFQAEAAAGEKS